MLWIDFVRPAAGPHRRSKLWPAFRVWKADARPGRNDAGRNCWSRLVAATIRGRNTDSKAWLCWVLKPPCSLKCSVVFARQTSFVCVCVWVGAVVVVVVVCV